MCEVILEEIVYKIRCEDSVGNSLTCNVEDHKIARTFCQKNCTSYDLFIVQQMWRLGIKKMHA